MKQNKPFYSKEIVLHYSCVCGQWFSISVNENKAGEDVKSCPHCGDLRTFAEKDRDQVFKEDLEDLKGLVDNLITQPQKSSEQ